MQLPRLDRIALLSAALFALPLATAALLGACGEDTGGQRVTLGTRITADDAATAPFTNAYGWTIHLTRAAISIGPIYYFDSETIFSARRWLGIGTAWAHPGHYQAGNALGQVLDPATADLLAGTTALPDGEGVSGTYRSGRFTYGSALGGHVVVIEGEATKGDQLRVFRAVADRDDVLDADGAPKLEGCAFAGAPEVQEDGTVTIHVRPSVWLDQADFSDVPESDGGAPVTLTEDLEAWRAFTRGLKKGSSVVFTYSPG